jgi:hypothetical protein
MNVDAFLLFYKRLIDLEFWERWLWEAISSGMWRRVIREKFTDDSDARTASIFTSKGKSRKQQQAASAKHCLIGLLFDR